MAKTHAGARPQKFFGKFQEPLVKLPNLVESQLNSFQQFVDEGAERVFKEFSTISDHSGKKFELKFIKFTWGEVRWDEQYAKDFNRTYETPLSIVASLKNKTTREISKENLLLLFFPCRLVFEGRDD